MVEPQLATLIDVGDAAHALAQHEHRFVQHRQQDAIDDEAGRVERMDHRLADLPGKGFHRGHRLGRGGKAANDLHQHHDRHGVEEMDAHEPAGVGRRLRQPRDRDGGCVGRQDRVRRQDRADIAEDRALHLLALGRRLDHQLRLGQRRDLAHRPDPRQRGVGVGLADLFLLDRARQQLGDIRLALFRARQVDVGQDHVIARLRRHLGDADAHLSRADHACGANIRHACHLPIESSPVP